MSTAATTTSTRKRKADDGTGPAGSRNVKTKTTDVPAPVPFGKEDAAAAPAMARPLSRPPPPPPPATTHAAKEDKKGDIGARTSKPARSKAQKNKKKPLAFDTMDWKTMIPQSKIPAALGRGKMKFINMYREGGKDCFVELKGDLVFTPSVPPAGAQLGDSAPRMTLTAKTDTATYRSAQGLDARSEEIYQKNAKRWDVEGLRCTGPVVREGKPVAEAERLKRARARKNNEKYVLPENEPVFDPQIEIGLPTVKDTKDVDETKIEIKDEDKELISWTDLMQGMTVKVVARIYMWCSPMERGQKLIAAKVTIVSRENVRSGAPDPTEDDDDDNNDEGAAASSAPKVPKALQSYMDTLTSSTSSGAASATSSTASC